MNSKDKTEEVLKAIHILFSKAEPIEGSKKRVIIDRDRMMSLLKDLNDCMYSMMDEYEITKRSKDRAIRDIQKQSDSMIFDARKNAEDIYAASIMYTNHAIDEVQRVIDRAKEDIDNAHEKLSQQIESRKKTLKDNQLDLKNQLSSLIDTQKYLMLIENENKRLKYEAEKRENEEEPKEAQEKATPVIRINEEYFKAAGLMPDEEDTREELPEIESVKLSDEEMQELDNEHFKWKAEEEKEQKKGLLGLGGRKK